jgi:hypothetical protein
MSSFIPRRALVVMAALVAGTLAQAVPALGADTLTPTPVNVTLQAGASTTVSKTLHLDGLPPRADIIVAVDTTGSMATPIAQAQADAVNICTQVQLAIPGARFAVMDFEDYPPPGPGQAGDVPYALKTPGFTSSCAVFSAAIATMTAVPGSGGDAPEAYNRAYYESYADGTNPIVLTRDPLATQFLVVLGDAAPHSSTAFGSCPASPPDDFGRDGIGGTADDLDTATTIAGLNASDITLLMIRYTTGGVSVPLSCYQDMANATGGTAVDDSGAGTIGPFIIANAQAVPYTVNLQVSAGCPIGFSFSPAFPQGPLTGPQTIPFTETITAPPLVGNYTCTITAVLTPGGPTTAVETVNVTVVVPTSTPGCKVTYGGRILAASGDEATFGGNAMVPTSGPRGQEEYQDQGPATAMNVHSIDVQAVTCSRDGTSASIFGTATIDGSGSFDFRIDVVDNGEPGAGSDTYRIRLNGYDSGVQTLLGGNIQIH